jgi:hypothetical protein
MADAVIGSGPFDGPLGAARSSLVSGWITPTLGDIPVVFGQGALAETSESRIELALVDLLPVTTAPAAHRPTSLQLLARMLVTAMGSGADQMLVALAFAALERGSPELERESIDIDRWRTGAAERKPGLVIRTILERPRVLRQPPRVREIVTQWSGQRPLLGRVVGPGDTPIAGAHIELDGAGVDTFSDHHGYFRLSAVPVGPPVPTLTVTAKGARQIVRAESGDEALVVRLLLPEL